MSTGDDEREIVQRLEAMLDVARSLAHERIDSLEDPVAAVVPFAVTWAQEQQKLLDLTDVAHALATPDGVNRIAATLISRYEADTFAIVSASTASETGDSQHPQAREVLRVILGHATGFSGSAFCDVQRTPNGPKLSGVWQTNDDSYEE